MVGKSAFPLPSARVLTPSMRICALGSARVFCKGAMTFSSKGRSSVLSMFVQMVSHCPF